MFPSQPAIMVTTEEEGMKLLRFLERRLEPEPPKSQLHKWIRTGQVRVNGKRAKPFQQLAKGDAIRVPPFAVARDIRIGAVSFQDGNGPRPLADEGSLPPAEVLSAKLAEDIGLMAETDTILVLSKPGGLACQSGQGQRDSLGERLKCAFAGSPYIPAPAHRLDRHTTGIVLAGKTFASQRRLHELFSRGEIGKEYLAWTAGSWPHTLPCLLENRLVLTNDGAGREYMAAEPGGTETVLPDDTLSAQCQSRTNCPEAACAKKEESQQASWECLQIKDFASAARETAFFTDEVHSSGMRPERERLFDADIEQKKYVKTAPEPGQARCIVIPVGYAKALQLASGNVIPASSLLLIRLLTGRKHQIRVQLASRGCPIIGDGRYGGPRFPQMLLHAYAVRIPEDGEVNDSNPLTRMPLEYCLPPPWPERFMPEKRELAEARQSMARIESMLF